MKSIQQDTKSQHIRITKTQDNRNGHIPSSWKVGDIIEIEAIDHCPTRDGLEAIGCRRVCPGAIRLKGYHESKCFGTGPTTDPVLPFVVE